MIIYAPFAIFWDGEETIYASLKLIQSMVFFQDHGPEIAALVRDQARCPEQHCHSGEHMGMGFHES